MSRPDVIVLYKVCLVFPLTMIFQWSIVTSILKQTSDVMFVKERISFSHKRNQSGKYFNPNELKVAIIIVWVFTLFSKVSIFLMITSLHTINTHNNIYELMNPEWMNENSLIF